MILQECNGLFQENLMYNIDWRVYQEREDINWEWAKLDFVVCKLYKTYLQKLSFKWVYIINKYLPAILPAYTDIWIKNQIVSTKLYAQESFSTH